MGEFEDKINNILSSPEEMEKIMSIAKSFSAGNDSDPKGDSPHKEDKGGEAVKNEKPGGFDLGSLDPKMLQMMSKFMKGYSSSSDSSNMALITAMKPYLKEDRHEKLDKAMQIAKMAKIARTAFSNNDGGKDDV